MAAIKLILESVHYYSNVDEEMFFSWLNKIVAISKIYGVGTALYLDADSSKLDEENLRELIAIFFRYQIDMTQLVQLMNDDNKSWFYNNKEAYWHNRVFG